MTKLMTSGITAARIYVDHGLTGTNRDRPGLRLALAACRAGDTLVVTKLDRLARSLLDARDILDELTKRNVKLSLGGSIHDPIDPVGRLLFNVLAMVPEFESDLIRMRTREGMKIATPMTPRPLPRRCDGGSPWDAWSAPRRSRTGSRRSRPHSPGQPPARS
jgi:DNA invertase Pin-like site-specific DNA recombinase